MAINNFTRFAFFFLIFSVSCIAQIATNGTIACAAPSGAPLRSTETYDPSENTDDGLGRLQMTINCTLNPNAGSTGYLSASYYSNPVTIAHPVDVSFTDGYVVVGNGSKAGWIFALEVTLPSGTHKTFKITYMSGATPAPNNQKNQSWPIVVSLPAGSTFKVDVYAFADDVSWCSSTCYGSAQWNLQ